MFRCYLPNLYLLTLNLETKEVWAEIKHFIKFPFDFATVLVNCCCCVLITQRYKSNIVYLEIY